MKRSILFVDDDILLIDGLRRSLRPMAREWDLHFADSGQRALEILSQNAVDLLVTDIRMPGMDGVQLLEIVSERFPQVLRFVLSGQTDQEMTIKTTRVAHQFIAKPCDYPMLIQIIRNALDLRDLQTNPQLIKVITSIKKLPSLPSLYVQLVREIESPNTSSKAIASIIAQDITMTAKILQLVNSAFYGLASKVTNLQQAVTILGTNTLKALVLSQKVFSEFQGERSQYLSIDALWRHSVAVGNLARSIAGSVNPNRELHDDAQVGGLMHDIGKLIQLSIPDFFQRRYILINDGADPLEAEYQILGTSHAELGAYLLGIWGLPTSVVRTVAYHHHPSRQTETAFSALTAVHVPESIMIRDLQEGKSPDNALDKNYLTAVNATHKLVSWVELYKTMSQNGLLSTGEKG